MLRGASMDMGRMAEVMPMPPNSIPMKGAVGPFGDYISMGGMFTIIKVRDRLESYDKDLGWYQHPRGTVALKASAADRAGIRTGDVIVSSEERVMMNIPQLQDLLSNQRGEISLRVIRDGQLTVINLNNQ